MSFDALKKNRGVSALDKVKEEIEKMNKKSFEKEPDARFWSLKKDKSGNGAALIRFLPAPEGEDLPWVRIFSHSFEGPGGKYIENSLTTLGKQDPVGEYNRQLWNSGIAANQDLARQQSRKTTYIANVFVIKDPANTENEGKVFLFRFGKKIFEKIQQLTNPADDPLEQTEPINPFCPWEGANFKLRVRQDGKYPNYDGSAFEEPSPLLSGNEKKIQAVYEKEYPLKEFVSEENFKTYEQLQSRLEKVLGGGSSGKAVSRTVTDTLDSVESDTSEGSSDDNVDMDYITRLAQGD